MRLLMIIGAPGLLACALFAAVAHLPQHLTGAVALTPAVCALFLGLLTARPMDMPVMQPGLAFASKPLLRVVIALLGFQITLQEIWALGPFVAIMVVLTMAITLAAILAAGRVLRVDPVLTLLLAAGTAVCGASAVVAVAAATAPQKAQVSFSIACVTVLGTAAMILYPIAGEMLGLSPASYGLWVGASVHEVAHVVAAGFQGGQDAGEVAVTSKMLRVAMLAPVVLLLVRIGARTTPEAGRPQGIPLYLLAFAAASVAASLGIVPAVVVSLCQQATGFLMAMSLFAIGTTTRMSSIRNQGFQPVLVGVLGMAVIAGFSLVWVRFVV